MLLENCSVASLLFPVTEPVAAELSPRVAAPGAKSLRAFMDITALMSANDPHEDLSRASVAAIPAGAFLLMHAARPWWAKAMSCG